VDEWQRVSVREQQRSESSAARIGAHIRADFADTFVAEAEYKHLLAELDGPEPDDLHHARRSRRRPDRHPDHLEPRGLRDPAVASARFSPGRRIP
jgi:hypothetical protein